MLTFEYVSYTEQILKRVVFQGNCITEGKSCAGDEMHWKCIHPR